MAVVKRDRASLQAEIRNATNVLRDNATVYRAFPKILLAVAFASEKGGLPIFGYDLPIIPGRPHNSGSKMYIVTGYHMLWHRIRVMKPGLRNYYETLENVPTNGYVDAEYMYEGNAESDAQWMHQTFLEEYKGQLNRLYGIPTAEVHVYILDSSNNRKFSKHYIFSIRGGHTMFKNNYHAGAFMRKLNAHILKKYGEATTNPFWVWTTRKDEAAPVRAAFYDMGVYTKRRQMRLYGNTKGNQPYRPLLLEGEDRTMTTINKQTFFDTIIQRVKDYSLLQLLQCLEEDGSEPISLGNRRKEGGPKTPIVGLQVQRVSRTGKGREGVRPSDPIPDFANELGKALLAKWDRTANYIEATHFYWEYQTIRYKTYSHVCAIKGGEHQGNHIWLRAYLGKKTFIQGCLDTVDCGDQVSEPIPIPVEWHDRIDSFLQSNPRRHDLYSTLVKHLAYCTRIPSLETEV